MKGHEEPKFSQTASENVPGACMRHIRYAISPVGAATERRARLPRGGGAATITGAIASPLNFAPHPPRSATDMVK